MGRNLGKRNSSPRVEILACDPENLLSCRRYTPMTKKPSVTSVTAHIR